MKLNWLLLILALIFFLMAAQSSYSGKISVSVEGNYRGGEIVTIYASLTNFTGERVNASSYCNVTIRHWNNTGLETDLNNVAMNWTGEKGWYYYKWQIPNKADKGSYGVLVKADPNNIDTQTTLGFNLAEWAEEIGHLWELEERVNTTFVIHNETITSATLSSTLNVTLYYNITIPLKEGFSSSDYLPMRWKFWFVDEEGNCMDQSRTQRFVEPYCNPLIAQIIGLGNHSYEVNISLRPSLNKGNYSIVRELEVDPQQVWISYGRGLIGKINVLEDNTQAKTNTSIIKRKRTPTTTLRKEIQEKEPRTSSSTTIIEEKKALSYSKVIGGAVEKGKKGRLIYLLLGLGIVVISAISAYLFFDKNRKE